MQQKIATQKIHFDALEVGSVLNANYDQKNSIIAHGNPPVKKTPPETPSLLEFSPSDAQESLNQSLAHTTTPKNPNNKQKLASISKSTSKNQIETLALTLNYLLKSQNSIESVLNDLIYNFRNFLIQLQTCQEQSKPEGQNGFSNNSLAAQLGAKTSFKDKKEPSFARIEDTLNALVTKIELMSKGTTSKLNEYESFLKSNDKQLVFDLNSSSLLKNQESEETNSHHHILNQKQIPLLSHSLADTFDKTSKTFSKQGLNQILQNASKTDDPHSLLNRRRSDFENSSGSQNSVNSKTEVRDSNNNMQQSDLTAYRINAKESNRFEFSRRSSQNRIDILQSSTDVRKQRPMLQQQMLHLNLTNRNLTNNIIGSNAEKAENFNAWNLSIAANTSNTYRDSMSKAINLRQAETNRNKKADLDNIISTIHDESKLVQTRIPTIRDNLETIPHTTRDITLEANNSSVKQFITVNPSTPTNHQETGSLSFRTPQSNFHRFEHTVRKLEIKPGMNELPKKDLSEFSFPDLSDENSPAESNPKEDPTGEIHDSTNPSNTEELLKKIAKNEKAVVKSLMKAQYGQDPPSYHKAEEGRMLQRKYLISSKWWRQWKDFVNFDAKTSVDNDQNALVFKPHLYKRPGLITNWDLIKEENPDDPQSSEYELDLRPNLLEHHDFEAVSKQIFEVLSTWYGCDYEMYRVLRPDPFHNNKLFLDLYPRKKFKRKQGSKSTEPVRPNQQNTTFSKEKKY